MAIKKMTKEERRQALRDRTTSNIKNKDSSGVQGKRILDLSEYKDVTFYKPKKGTNSLDIIPYLVSTERHPQGLKVGQEDYVLDVWVHGWVGPGEDSFLCLKKTFGKPCPICEEIANLMQGENPNKKQIKSMQAKRRCFYNVIDLDDRDKEEVIQLFEVSHFLFEKELLEEAETAEEEVIIFSDIEEGRTIRCRASQETMEGGKPFFKFKSFSFGRRKKAYKESIIEKSYPLDALLIIPAYEEVKNAFFGIDDDGEANEHKDQENEGEAEDTRGDSRRERRDREPKKSKTACPHNHTYGTDCDEYREDCDDCDVWDKCADERDRLNDKE